MQIVCPHCQTAYEVSAESIGPEGRTVRCARCKQTWMAMPVPEAESVGADAPAGDSLAMPGSEAEVHDPDQLPAVPDIESPPLAADMPPGSESDSTPIVDVVADPTGTSRLGRTRRRAAAKKPPPILTVAAAVMAALAVGIVSWRGEIVRLMPQTSAFFGTLGLGVNLRGIEIENVRVSADKVDGTTMMLVEGELRARRNTDVPRLRFSVHDEKGAELHSWNAAPSQPTMHVGERIAFRTILASPPRDGREIAVRFLQRGDMSAGVR